MRFQRPSRPGRSSRSGGAIGSGGGGGSLTRPTVIATSTLQSTATTASIDIPTGSSEGDTVLVLSSNRNNGAAFPVLTGGTTIADYTEPYTKPVVIAYKVLTAGDITAGTLGLTSLDNPNTHIAIAYNGAGTPVLLEELNTNTNPMTFTGITSTTTSLYSLMTCQWLNANVAPTYSIGFSLEVEFTSLLSFDTVLRAGTGSFDEAGSVTPSYTQSQLNSGAAGFLVEVPGA